MKKLTAIVFALVLTLSMSATALAAGGSTNVKVTVDSSQISVTVPLEIAITAKVDGGTATTPTDYTITNGSAIPIKVDTIAVVNNNTAKWAFSANPISANTNSVGAGVNDIYLRVNGEVLKAQTATAPTNAQIATLPWNFTPGEVKTLGIECSTSKLNQTTEEGNLITITYVISAGSWETT